MLERKVLIVDDDIAASEDVLEEYNGILRKLQRKYDIKYNIKFLWEKSITTALERLNSQKEVIDILLVDYDFSKDDSSAKNLKGIEFVKKVRQSINKRCKIVFYTMHGISGISQREYVDLINNNVFRFVSKSGETFPLNYEKVGNMADQIIIEQILEALDASDPITLVLESYLIDYFEIVKDAKINVGGKLYSIDDIVKSIRLDQEPGNGFIKGLIEMKVLKSLEVR